MSDTTKNQLGALLEYLQETETALNRQNVTLTDYHTTIRNAGDHNISMEDASKELHRIFQNLEADYSDLDKKNSDAPSSISSLGLASFLCNVPPILASSGGGEGVPTDGDYKSLYEELTSAYSANERSREYCVAAFNALAQYHFRKTAKLGQRNRRLELAEDSHQRLERFTKSLGAQLPALTFFFHDRAGMGTVVEIVVDRIFRLVLLMRGVVVEGVNIRSSDEQYNLEPKALKPIDLWSPSYLEVFRILTRNAQAALLHFQMPHQPEQSFKNYLQWINSFATLFSVPCRRCSKYLDNGMPPTFRDYRKLEPYHEGCRLLSFTPV